MKPPEKIYLQVDENGKSYDTYYEGVTWCQDRINDTDIKYIRADLATCYPTSGIKPTGEGKQFCKYCRNYHMIHDVCIPK